MFSFKSLKSSQTSIIHCLYVAKFRSKKWVEFFFSKRTRFFPLRGRKIKEAKARTDCSSSPPDVLMKVLSGSIAVSSETRNMSEEPSPDGLLTDLFFFL